MILFCTTTRDLEVWYLALAGQLARPPASPTVYALVSFDAESARYYVGSSQRFTARLGAHLSFARSRKLRGSSAGGKFLAPIVARRRRLLVVVLETLPGADTGSLQRCEQAWFIVAQRDNGAAALPLQVPATTAPARGPLAPATLAARRHWPRDWVEALAGFFQEPRRANQDGAATRRAVNGQGKTQQKSRSGTRRTRRSGMPAGSIAEAGRR